jgi:nucleoside-diphosphate-sugar epimerase
MRIGVTGAAGYIGSRLVGRLQRAGHEVVSFDRERPRAAAGAAFVRCDLTDAAAYEGALAGLDLLCHLAAAKGDWGISDDEYRRDNVAATEALLGAALRAGVRNWIFYSTVSVLGPSDVAIDERAPRRPVNPYGATKAECEALFERHAREVPDARVLVIRPSVVFGPGNPDNTNIHRLVDAIHHDRFVMIGRGREVKTTSFIDNLLDAHEFLMARDARLRPSGVEVFHYVDEPGETTAALVARIYGLLGRRRPRLRLPLALAAPLALAGDAAAGLFRVDLPITSARVRKFCTATNFDARAIRREGFVQRVGNEEALRQTVEWYLEDLRQATSRDTSTT